jgi:hypothetical protein
VAIETMERDEHNKALARVALGKAQARAGDKAGAMASLIAAFESAKEIKARANLINDNVAWNKDEAFRAIARAQVEGRDIAVALVTVSGHDNQSIRAEIQAEVAVFQARQGDVAAAMKTAESIANASSKAEALMRIAHFQSKMGRREAAHDWAAQRGSPQERALALLGVVEGVFAQRRGE